MIKYSLNIASEGFHWAKVDFPDFLTEAQAVERAVIIRDAMAKNLMVPVKKLEFRLTGWSSPVGHMVALVTAHDFEDRDLEEQVGDLPGGVVAVGHRAPHFPEMEEHEAGGDTAIARSNRPIVMQIVE